jgi:predicted metalloendopeptidase
LSQILSQSATNDPAFAMFSGEIENWWDSDTEENYKKKEKCMIDQYSGFTARQVCKSRFFSHQKDLIFY